MTEVAVRELIFFGLTRADDAASPLAGVCMAGTPSAVEPSGPLADPGQPAVPATDQGRRRRRWWPRGFLPNALIALAAVGFLTGACLDACTGTNIIRRVPAVHGRVVDMETGQPVAGVRVTRWFERERIAGPGGSDTYRVKSSLRTATSDAAGRFQLPPWYGVGRGISSIHWTEYKPGWVAGWGNLSLVTTPPTFLVARMGGSHDSVQIDTQRGGSALAVTLKLHRVDSPPAAEEQFWALRTLSENGSTPLIDFVREATEYVAQHNVTEEMLLPLADLTDRINPYVEPTLVDQRCAILRGIAKYCMSSAESRWCRSATVTVCLRDYKVDCSALEKQR
jgi:hypothetical protein